MRNFAWSPESDRIAAYVQTNLVTQDGILVMIELDDDTVGEIRSKEGINAPLPAR